MNKKEAQYYTLLLTLCCGAMAVWLTALPYYFPAKTAAETIAYAEQLKDLVEMFKGGFVSGLTGLFILWIRF